MVSVDPVSASVRVSTAIINMEANRMPCVRTCCNAVVNADKSATVVCGNRDCVYNQPVTLYSSRMYVSLTLLPNELTKSVNASSDVNAFHSVNAVVPMAMCTRYADACRVLAIDVAGSMDKMS